MNVGGSRFYDFGAVKIVNSLRSSSFPDGSYGGQLVNHKEAIEKLQNEEKNLILLDFGKSIEA